MKNSNKPNTASNKVLSSTTRCTQNIATLVNSPQGSDIEFKVGGDTSTLQENAKITKPKSTAVTLYAHSNILRCRSGYFTALLDKDKNWKEGSKTLINKPNISPRTLEEALYYIYTGIVRARNSTNTFELIIAAEEMKLQELSTACQAELIRTIRHIFLAEGCDEDNDDESESEGTVVFEESTNQWLSIDVAIRTHVIPALNIASNHSLSPLSRKVLDIILPRMSLIIDSSNVYTKFVAGISSEVLIKILQSDHLALKELSVWDLALSWACHQSNLTKTAVEARLKQISDDGDEEDIQKKSDDSVASISQLKQLKTILSQFLPAIRLSLLEDKEYAHMMYILDYFLPGRRSLELQRFFIDPDYKEKLDSPRMAIIFKLPSSIIVETSIWKLLRKNIFETGGIVGCTSLKDFNFELLFRASEHGFLAQTFHQRCDNKGPTLTIVKSTDGHIFGGVNFTDWSTNGSYSNCNLNFLFAIPDGQHRKDSAIFRIDTNNSYSQYSAYNNSGMGPSFGYGSDLQLANSANTQNSLSNLPRTYNGSGASNTALAGAQQFCVSDYEVFAISKKIVT